MLTCFRLCRCIGVSGSIPLYQRVEVEITDESALRTLASAMRELDLSSFYVYLESEPNAIAPLELWLNPKVSYWDLKCYDLIDRSAHK